MIIENSYIRNYCQTFSIFWNWCIIKVAFFLKRFFSRTFFYLWKVQWSYKIISDYLFTVFLRLGSLAFSDFWLVISDRWIEQTNMFIFEENTGVPAIDKNGSKSEKTQILVMLIMHKIVLKESYCCELIFFSRQYIWRKHF